MITSAFLKDHFGPHMEKQFQGNDWTQRDKLEDDSNLDEGNVSVCGEKRDD